MRSICQKTRSNPTSLRRAGSDALVSPDVWLWVPSPRPVGVAMQLDFTLPDGLVALLPWQATLPETAFAWKSAGAFGHAPPTPLLVPGGELSVAALGDGFGPHASAVRAWLAQGARAASLLFGHFPVPRALVIAVPGDRSGPGFGMALRGGGPAVVIFLGRHPSGASLANDWTATHEFLHLGVPRLPPEDAWLFEGLASYYTEVVRARAGIISPAQAYQHLLEGFERGRSNGSSLSLREESRQMHERHSYYRVYWAGAALAFLTDVEARRASGPTLDGALRSFAECCAASEDDWTAERVLASLGPKLGCATLQRAGAALARSPRISGSRGRAARPRRRARCSRPSHFRPRTPGSDPRRDHGSGTAFVPGEPLTSRVAGRATSPRVAGQRSRTPRPGWR